MSENTWTAITVLTVTLISSWGQLWVKEYREKVKASASARAEARQPAINRQRSPGLWVFMKRRWRMVVTQLVINIVAVEVLRRQYISTLPVTRGTVIFVAITTALWSVFTLVSSAIIFMDEGNSN